MPLAYKKFIDIVDIWNKNLNMSYEEFCNSPEYKELKELKKLPEFSKFQNNIHWGIQYYNLMKFIKNLE